MIKVVVIFALRKENIHKYKKLYLYTEIKFNFSYVI